MRRGFTLVESLVALAIGVGVIAVLVGFWSQSGRVFFRARSSIELSVGARLVAESMVRDIQAAHQVLPPKMTGAHGEVLRLVRYLGQEEADLESRRQAAYIDGVSAAEAGPGFSPGARLKRFAAQQVVYTWNEQGRLTRTTIDGSWAWITDAALRKVEGMRFEPGRGAPLARQLASNVTLVKMGFFGYPPDGRLDRICAIGTPSL
jgi:prepilin-type N-terminal cleavage/methylation domain-containing protein